MNIPFRFRICTKSNRLILFFTTAVVMAAWFVFWPSDILVAAGREEFKGSIVKESRGGTPGLDSVIGELTEAKKRFRKFRGYAEFLFDSAERMNSDFIIEMREIESLAEGEKILMAKYRSMAMESKFINPLDILVKKFDAFYSDVDREFGEVGEMSLKFNDTREGAIYTTFLRAIEDDRKGIEGFADEFRTREKFIKESYSGLKSIFDSVRYEDGALVYKPRETGVAGTIPSGPSEPSKTSGSSKSAEPAETAKPKPPAEPVEALKVSVIAAKPKPPAEPVEVSVMGGKAGKSRELSFEKLPPRVPATSEYTRPICVIIENHKGARPQSGMQLADVVFEILAEGGITRFLGVFHTENHGIVGPIRSCRHYLTDLCSWFDGILIHCGSSSQGLQAVAARGVENMNEIEYGAPFYRVNFRKAPHNLYTTLEKIRIGIERLGWRVGTDVLPPPALFQRNNEPLSGGSVTLPRISYHKNYGVAYIYDQETNSYLRTMAGAPHLNHGTREQLRADNVLVVLADTTEIDNYGRLDIILTGTGPAMLFTGGHAFWGEWRKTGVRSPMTFHLTDGGPMLFNPGNVWVQVIRESTKVTPPMEAPK